MITTLDPDRDAELDPLVEEQERQQKVEEKRKRIRATIQEIRRLEQGNKALVATTENDLEKFQGGVSEELRMHGLMTSDEIQAYEKSANTAIFGYRHIDFVVDINFERIEDLGELETMLGEAEGVESQLSQQCSEIHHGFDPLRALMEIAETAVTCKMRLDGDTDIGPAVKGITPQLKEINLKGKSQGLNQYAVCLLRLRRVIGEDESLSRLYQLRGKEGFIKLDLVFTASENAQEIDRKRMEETHFNTTGIAKSKWASPPQSQ